ncbi:type VI secretion system baseplate subunit TssE [Limnobacter humi]|uniref:Type VI secretion system baseplate subunit TssE n=1 Tax=Limnobacter humi TaxID=1778671 RepID=A0ABT1WG74_9BURK|nr:type VI secretion system baseplate subunit TssE [Limnobacter humi]MCQ8895762.1 type VI secretion system baseplate subunit TssE [Limnobacter humi]
MSEARQWHRPTLLERLLGQAAEQGLTAKNDGHAAWSRDALRASVIHDLEHLMNASPCDTSGLSGPARHSVLAYGLPPMAGQLASSVHVRQLEQTVHQALVHFEPRIVPGSLQVKAEADHASLNHHNVIHLQITAALHAHPVPVELVLRSEIDLETGRVALVPLTGF